MLVDNSVKFKTLDGLTVYDTVLNWDLILEEQADEQKPGGKWQYIDVPGAAGSIDVTRALSQDVPPEDRTVTLKFAAACDSHSDCVDLIDAVTQAVHLQRLYIQTPDNAAAGLWYEGNCEIKAVNYIDTGVKFTITALCNPYKLAAVGGSLALLPSVKTTIATGDLLAHVSPGALDSNGLEFKFSNFTGQYYYAHNALAATFASGSNLFDMNLANVRLKTCQSGGTWKNSGKMRQSGQTIQYGSVAKTWAERAAFTATNATAEIYHERFPLTGNSHLYVFVESSAITDSGSVTYDGTTRSAGVRVEKIWGIFGSIGGSGAVNNGASTSYTQAAPAIGSSFSIVIDCGTVNSAFGQLLIDVIGITADWVNVQIMMIEDGSPAPTAYEEPNILQAVVPMPEPFERHKVNGAWVYDSYTSMMPRAFVNSWSGDVLQAPTISEWPRDAVYVDFGAVNSSGWIVSNPAYTVEIDDWPANTATVSATMPTYPVITTDASGAVLEYNGNINIVGPSAIAEVPTLFNVGVNNISYPLPGDAAAAASLTYEKGDL